MCALQHDAGGQRREDRGGKCAVEPDESGPAGLAAGALGQEVPGGVEEAGGYYQAQGEEGYEVVLLSVGPRHTARRMFASTLRPIVSLRCAPVPGKGPLKSGGTARSLQKAAVDTTGRDSIPQTISLNVDPARYSPIRWRNGQAPGVSERVGYGLRYPEERSEAREEESGAQT